uniref:Uncharacterized protein n=1 Tax=Vespula pensylvanica TaxID=30213 RepID=A0A834KHY9_VESPE|nr:hypothetical protein H0235_014724 [Vespula pensylvanica]
MCFSYSQAGRNSSSIDRWPVVTAGTVNPSTAVVDVGQESATNLFGAPIVHPFGRSNLYLQINLKDLANNANGDSFDSSLGDARGTTEVTRFNNLAMSLENQVV